MKTKKWRLSTLILSLLMIAISCNNDQEILGKQKLSDAELTKLVLSDSDFNSFILAKTKEDKELQGKIFKLNSSDKTMLIQLLQNFESYETFVAQSTSGEKAFVTNIFQVDNTSNQHFDKLVSKLNKYEYNVLSLLELAKSSTPSPEYGRTNADCASVALGAYSRTVFTMINAGQTIANARWYADIAYNWAYVGCVGGQQ